MEFDLTGPEAIRLRYKRALQFAKKLLTSRELKDKIEVKEDGALVAGLGKRIDELFRTIIGRSVFKGDQIISEESQGEFDPDNGSCWVLDPLDGAANYLLDRLPYAASIGYVLNNDPVLGVVVVPRLKGFSIISALKGQGVEVDGLPFSSTAPRIPMAGLDFKIGEEDKLTRLLGVLHEKYGEVRIPGSVVSGFLDVALGSLSFYVHACPRTWEMAAVLAILKEAGKVTDVESFNLAELAKNDHRLGATLAAQDEQTKQEATDLIMEAAKSWTEEKIIAEFSLSGTRDLR
jgi:myo-inositol-1(or 4)-monophosphatase